MQIIWFMLSLFEMKITCWGRERIQITFYISIVLGIDTRRDEPGFVQCNLKATVYAGARVELFIYFWEGENTLERTNTASQLLGRITCIQSRDKSLLKFFLDVKKRLNSKKFFFFGLFFPNNQLIEIFKNNFLISAVRRPTFIGKWK